MTVKTGSTGGLDAVVAVDDRSVLPSDGKALDVLGSIARSHDVAFGLDIETVTREWVEFVNRAPLHAFLWLNALNDIWCADKDILTGLGLVDGDIVYHNATPGCNERVRPSLRRSTRLRRRERPLPQVSGSADPEWRRAVYSSWW